MEDKTPWKSGYRDHDTTELHASNTLARKHLADCMREDASEVQDNPELKEQLLTEASVVEINTGPYNKKTGLYTYFVEEE